MIAAPTPIGTARPRRATFIGSRDVLIRLFRRRDASLGLVIMIVFTVFALIPTLLVGQLETAVTATGPRLEPPQAGYPLGTESSAAACST